MIDHIGFTVKDFAATKAFYVAALGALGYTIKFEDGPQMYFVHPKTGGLWVGQMGEPVNEQIHIGFGAESEAAVQQFYEAALAAGGTDNGAPGPRPNYGPHYYAAFVIDPNGHNIEAVFRG